LGTSVGTGMAEQTPSSLLVLIVLVMLAALAATPTTSAHDDGLKPTIIFSNNVAGASSCELRLVHTSRTRVDPNRWTVPSGDYAYIEDLLPEEKLFVRCAMSSTSTPASSSSASEEDGSSSSTSLDGTLKIEGGGQSFYELGQFATSITRNTRMGAAMQPEDMVNVMHPKLKAWVEEHKQELKAQEDGRASEEL
jgi:hypothetical protein